MPLETNCGILGGARPLALPSMGSDGFWVHLVASRCQFVAGRIIRDGIGGILEHVRRLPDDLPDGLHGPDQLLIPTLLTQTLLRVAQHYSVSRDLAFTREFLDLTAVRWGCAWRARWVRAVNVCAAAGGVPGSTERGRNGTAARVLDVIETRFREPALNERVIAEAADLSVGHLSRLLRRATGAGYTAHLHRCRVSAATRLIAETSLTMKEIAAMVGYRDQGQLSRHFRRIHGVTPTRYRAAHSARRRSA